MRVEQQQAFVIHTRPFRDTSLLVDCFTRQYGRLTLVAKGARSPKSQFRALLQPFKLLSLSWQGRGSLKTLIDAESLDQFFSLEKKFLYSALYVNELLLNLVPVEDPSDSLFEHYFQLLISLEKQLPLEPSLRRFEFTFLKEIGYGIDFFSGADNGQLIDQQKLYHYVIGQGFIEALTNHLEQPSILGQTIIAIAEQQYDDAEVLKVAKYISRLTIDDLLDGRPLKSREFFRQLSTAL